MKTCGTTTPIGTKGTCSMVHESELGLSVEALQGLRVESNIKGATAWRLGEYVLTIWESPRLKSVEPYGIERVEWSAGIEFPDDNGVNGRRAFCLKGKTPKEALEALDVHTDGGFGRLLTYYAAARSQFQGWVKKNSPPEPNIYETLVHGKE